jgi:hypothetical protein
MNAPITFAVRRNIDATDKRGTPCKIAMAVIRFPDGTGTTLAIPEGLLATIPADKLDDFIASEVEAIVGYEVTRQ